jgi:ribonuclease BN (tRNA processing enzyme)
MKLTVLGGSAACPNPGQGSSAYLLETAGQRWLLDCGPNTISELRKHIELDELDLIVISHVHSDHTIDLVPYRYGMKYVPGMTQRRIPLWMPPDGIGFLARVAAAFAVGTEGAEDFFDAVFEVQEYVPEHGLEQEGVSVQFFPTNHPVPCWAMRIESSEGVLVYLADTGPQDNLVDIARDADIFIGEGTVLDDSDVEGITDRPHISAFEAGTIAREAGVDQFVLTHYWADLGPERYLKAAEKAFRGPVILAKPGVTVEARNLVR